MELIFSFSGNLFVFIFWSIQANANQHPRNQKPLRVKPGAGKLFLETRLIPFFVYKGASHAWIHQEIADMKWEIKPPRCRVEMGGWEWNLKSLVIEIVPMPPISILSGGFSLFPSSFMHLFMAHFPALVFFFSNRKSKKCETNNLVLVLALFFH